MERWPEPTGVVVGPLMAMPLSRMESSVRSGRGLPSSSYTSTPASWKSQSNSTPVASSTRLVASASSGPVPSPGMKVTLCVKTVLSNLGGAFFQAAAAEAEAQGDRGSTKAGMNYTAWNSVLANALTNSPSDMPSTALPISALGWCGLPPSRVVFGGGSIQLARVFGIRIGVDVSWFIVLFIIIYWLTGYYRDDVGAGSDAFLLATVSALLFFLSILLPELGHAVVAIRNGIPILGIDLWLFGGVAKLGRDTDSPGVEFRVAVAGPLVTLMIAAVCFGPGALISSPHEALEGAVYDSSVSSQATAVLGY